MEKNIWLLTLWTVLLCAINFPLNTTAGQLWKSFGPAYRNSDSKQICNYITTSQCNYLYMILCDYIYKIAQFEGKKHYFVAPVVCKRY